MRNLHQFAAGPYQQALGRSSVTFPIVAVPGTDRLTNLRTWVEAELREQGIADEYGRFFRLAALPLGWQIPEPDRPTPEEIFFAPRWYRPFATEPEPLFPEI